MKQIKINEQSKYAFCGTFIIGFLCYFYFMTHHFLTYDSLWNLVSDQNMISSGRQFLSFVCSISSDFDLPAVNGILAIIYLSMTAVLLVSIFDVKKRSTAILIGGLVVTFPSVASTFCYSYTVDGYMMAILIITLAFWITNRFSKGFVFGAFLTAFSIGIYQAYYAYLIILCILILLIRILEEEKIRKVLGSIWRYICMGIGGYIIYVLTLKVMLAFSEVPVTGYQGTDKVLGFPFGNILVGIKTAFIDAKNFARWGHVFSINTPMKCAYFLLIVIGVLLYVYYFIQKNRYLQIWHIVLTIILLISLPLGINIIMIISPDTYAHVLTRFAWVLLFVFVLILAERIELYKIHNISKICISLLAYVCSAIMIFEFAVTANIVAFNMEARYEKTYGLCLRIVDRLEQIDEYETGEEVAILGGILDQEYYPSTNVTEEYLSGFFGHNGDYSVNSTAKIAEFCKHYLNFSIQTISGEREEEITETPEYKEMDKFPSSGSIKEINGVWVIKLNG